MRHSASLFRSVVIPQRRYSAASLFSGGAIRPQLLDRERRKAIRERFEIGSQASEGRRALEAPLVHVERAVELELDGMQPGSRIAVMLGNEAAGIGLVA